MTRPACCCLILLCLAAQTQPDLDRAPTTVPTARPASQSLENPQFQAWSRFGVGSTVTLSGTMDTGAAKVQLSLHSRLVEKGEDFVLVEVTGSTTTAGRTQTTAPQMNRITAKTTELYRSGEQTIDAMGRSFRCTVWEGLPGASPGAAPDTAAGNTNGRKGLMYVSPEVPGGLVKLEATHPQGSLNLLLKSFEAK